MVHSGSDGAFQVNQAAGALQNVDPSMRDQVIADIRNDRRAWRLTEVPQLITLTFLLIALATIAIFGLGTAIIGMREAKASLQLAKAIPIFVGGSSSLLGFAVLKLSVRLSEMTRRYLGEQKRFTSDLNRVRLCSSTSEIDALLKQYYKLNK
jgi:hypothetical protein